MGANQVVSLTPSHLAFRWLWGGQLISNLGTQTSLYGIGLWLFAQSGRLLDFGLVAVVVQLARLVALPLMVHLFSAWHPRRLMLLSHSIGAGCTAVLTLLLLGREGGSLPALQVILAVQGVAAIAEACLVVRLASLIPLLITEQHRLQRANGLLATVDGLVITMAPFLGTWLVASWGLAGVLLLDGISFVIAFASVLVAPWQQEALKGSLTGASHPQGAPLRWMLLLAGSISIGLHGIGCFCLCRFGSVVSCVGGHGLSAGTDGSSVDHRWLWLFDRICPVALAIGTLLA